MRLLPMASVLFVLSSATHLVGCSDESNHDAGSGGGGPPSAAGQDPTTSVGGTSGTSSAGEGGTAGTNSGNQFAEDPFPPRCTASCAVADVCVGDACCPPATPTGAFQLPTHTTWIDYDFGPSPVASVEFEIYVGSDPGEQVGMYISPYNGNVGPTGFYFGIQTNVRRPDVGWTGKGFVFSRWDTLDAADSRTGPDGFIEVGTHEGEFVGVRQNHAWKVGWYRLRLARAEQDGNRDWFDLYVDEIDSDETVYVGGLRFPREDPNVPATIASKGIGFSEVYAFAEDYAAVPQWHVQVRARADGSSPLAAISEYPAYPYAEYPNADVFYNPDSDLIHLTYGGQTSRCHAAGLLF